MRKKSIGAIAALLLLPMAALSQVSAEELRALVAQQDDYARTVRRQLHEHPEVGGKELKTVSYLKQQLARIGQFEIHDVPGSTGFYAILDTHRPGLSIGLRTDIDGLPIQEQPLNGGGKRKPWLSKEQGVTQGCGHDAHMAILLSTARILHGLRDRLDGRFVLIFEEGEETNTGIRPMVAALRSVKLDAIYGNHVASNVPTGTVCIRNGAVMAGMATLAFHVKGRGGHASRPDQTVNPVVAAASIVTSLNVAWNNQRDLTKLVTLGIAQLEGGLMYNIIPDSAFIGGTMRFFDPAAGEHALGVVKSVAENVAAAHGCTVSYEPVMRVNLPPVVNDSLLARRSQQAMERLFPGHVVDDAQYAWYASETFALYSQLAPSVLTLVGTRNEELGTTAAHHTAQFDVDDACLPYGIGSMAAFAISQNQRGTTTDGDK